jgi:hypothetical protein
MTKLETLLEKANLPWEFRPNGSDNGLDATFCVAGQPREYGAIDILGGGDQTQLALHAVNMLPKLAKALEATQLVLMEFGGKDDERYTRERRAAYRQAETVLAEANNPEVK